MNDHLLRVLDREAGIRGFACVTTALSEEAICRHHAAPMAGAVLSQGLTGAALLGATLKVRQRMAVKVQGSGPSGKLAAESDAYGRVRGYVSAPDFASPQAVTPESMAAAIGHNGLLTVTKDVGLKDLYQGVVSLQSGRLDEELTHYLVRSEQIPSAVEIGVAVDENDWLTHAGGLLLQALPGADEKRLRVLLERLDDLPPLATLLRDGETPYQILAALFRDGEMSVLEERPLAFSCSCSRERTRKALQMIGAAEIRSLMDEGQAVIECHFCHEEYIYGVEELGEILADETAI